MKNTTILYRPVWTCGRFHEESASALMYNLLAGYSFFFEDDSSVVIGAILEIERGKAFTPDDLEGKTGISVESLLPFLDQLESVGLICGSPMVESTIEEYRKLLNSSGLFPEMFGNNTDQLIGNQSDAEKAYFRRSKVPVAAAMFELTYCCSEKCIHCYNPGATRNDDEISHRARKELSLTDYKRIIDDLYENGLVKVCITGGDPFSKKEVWDILEYLHEKELAVELFTNGQGLLGKEERLAALFPSDVGVSLYGPNAEIHDSVTRVKGSFDKSLSVLEKLRELHVPTAIKFSMMQYNFKSYTEMFGLAEHLGADLQIECRLFDSMDGDKCISKYLRLTPEQLRVVFRDKRLPFYVGEDLPEYGAIPQDMEHIACRAGIQNFCITPEGYMIPCCSYHAVFGDLSTESFRKIIDGNEEYELFTKTKLSKYDECGRHDYCAFCKMCPGLNFSENGTPLKAGENNCYIAKIRHQLSLDLKQGIDPLKGMSLEDALHNTKSQQMSHLKRIPSNNHLNQELSL